VCLGVPVQYAYSLRHYSTVLFIEAAHCEGAADCEACTVGCGDRWFHARAMIWGFTPAGSQFLRAEGTVAAFCPRIGIGISSISTIPSRPVAKSGESPRDRWAGAGADEVHMARLCSYCALRNDGKPSKPDAGRSGFVDDRQRASHRR
jgi:hypothetical protein